MRLITGKKRISPTKAAGRISLCVPSVGLCFWQLAICPPYNVPQPVMAQTKSMSVKEPYVFLIRVCKIDFMVFIVIILKV